MKHPLTTLLAWLALAVATHGAPKPNVLFIAIDDLRCDLGTFGVAHAKTPRLDAFAGTARLFTRHYVQVPTCGASRCALLSGRYPTVPAHVGNDAIKRTAATWGAESLPATFKKAGYRTLALGKLTHHPGGLTGKGWAEGPEELPGAWDRAWVPDGPWKTPEALMHGYADGVARQPGKSPPMEAHAGPDTAYPDAWVAADAVKTLRELAAGDRPWFFGVGFFKPHLPFAAPESWHRLHADDAFPVAADVSAKPTWQPNGWHRSNELRGNYGHPDGVDPATHADYALRLRRAYAAAVSYVDAQVGRVLDELHTLGLDGNTVVVVWSDHGFLLGEHAIWGKHCLYDRTLHSPLLIRTPGLAQPGRSSAALVEAVDIFPTLTDVCGLTAPAALDGRSLRPQLDEPTAPTAKPARSWWTGGLRTLRTERWRLVAHPRRDGAEPAVELFDMEKDPEETHNHAAEQPAVVAELLAELNKRPALAPRRAEAQ